MTRCTLVYGTIAVIPPRYYLYKKNPPTLLVPTNATHPQTCTSTLQPFRENNPATRE